MKGVMILVAGDATGDQDSPGYLLQLSLQRALT